MFYYRYHPRGILSGGILERGDFVLGGYCPGDIVRGDIVRGDIVLEPMAGIVKLRATSPPGL